jgi:hypothetical protein
VSSHRELKHKQRCLEWIIFDSFMIVLETWCTYLQCRPTSVLLDFMKMWMVQDLLITSSIAFPNEHALVLVWRASPAQLYLKIRIGLSVGWLNGVYMERPLVWHYSMCVKLKGTALTHCCSPGRENSYKDAFAFHIRDPINWFLHWERPL